MAETFSRRMSLTMREDDEVGARARRVVYVRGPAHDAELLSPFIVLHFHTRSIHQARAAEKNALNHPPAVFISQGNSFRAREGS